MRSNKRSLSLPAAARRISKKSTKQAVPHDSQPQADENDRQLLVQLLAAEPGAEVGVDAEADDIQEVEPQQQAPDPGGFPDDRFTEPHAPAETDDMTMLQAGDMSRVQHETNVQDIPRQQDQQQHQPAAAPFIAAISDQTLMHEDAEHTTVPSPMTAAGQRSKRACSNKAKQMMAIMEDDTDGDNDSPTPKRRKSSKKRQEDSDFEAGEPSSSSSDDDAGNDAASEEDEDFGMSDEEERPKKKAKKGTGTKKASVKAAKSRASTGSVAAPKSGRGSAKGSGRTAQASAAGAASGACRKTSNRAASGRAASGQGRAASCRAAHSLETAGASSLPAPTARQPITSPAARAAGGEAFSGSSCAMGGPRSGHQPITPGATPPGAGQRKVPLAPLPAMPDVATAAAVQCESAGHVTGVEVGRATTAASGAGPTKPAASAVSHHGPGLSRPRPAATAAEASSPARPAASTCSASSKANSLSSNSSSLGGSRKQLGVRTGGRLGLGLSAAGGGGGGTGALNSGLNSTVNAGGAAMGGMFGGPAFRVPGLRRPGPKKPVAQ